MEQWHCIQLNLNKKLFIKKLKIVYISDRRFLLKTILYKRRILYLHANQTEND